MHKNTYKKSRMDTKYVCTPVCMYVCMYVCRSHTWTTKNLMQDGRYVHTCIHTCTTAVPDVEDDVSCTVSRKSVYIHAHTYTYYHTHVQSAYVLTCIHTYTTAVPHVRVRMMFHVP